jgi:putative membrane protein
MYEPTSPDKLILRDYLALDRTHLANERTLLAYIRTALMMLISGITLIKLFQGQATVVFSGYLMFSVSLIVLGIGAWRFFKMRRRIIRAEIVSTTVQGNDAH